MSSQDHVHQWNDDVRVSSEIDDEVGIGSAPLNHLGALSETSSSDSTTVTALSIDKIRRGPVIRVMGDDPAHARLLACTPAQLPPILVDKSTMAVIDGMHRLLAAKLRGEKKIDVVLFEGSEAQGFVAAVRANIAHGKPLSLADREHAAERIMVLCPDWSDRAISETCGLSPKTIASIRRRSTEGIPQLAVRTGRDGRTRPLDPVPGRKRIAAAIAADPTASVRQIADRTTTSVGTVQDVRRRLKNGENPLPQTLLATATKADAIHGLGSDTAPRSGWTTDPALAATDEALQFARWFDSSAIRPEDYEMYVDVPPLSRLYELIAVARSRARAWEQFASALESRARKQASARPTRE